MYKRVAVAWISAILLFGAFIILDDFTDFTPSVAGATVYVNETGAGGAYIDIQEAINNASVGDTIFVYNGTYEGNILINKTLNLTGENRNGTVIQGDGTGIVVNISADWVNMSSFTIKCFSSDYDAIEINGINCNISDVEIDKNLTLSLNFPIVNGSGSPGSTISFTMSYTPINNSIVNIIYPSPITIGNFSGGGGYIINFTKPGYSIYPVNITTIKLLTDPDPIITNYSVSIITTVANFSTVVYANNFTFTNMTSSWEPTLHVISMNNSIDVLQPYNSSWVSVINYTIDPPDMNITIINITTITMKPLKPANLTALSSDSYVLLSWDMKSMYNPIINYSIFRGTEPGNETFLLKIGNITYFNDTNVTNGVTYYYRVSAANSMAEGSLSNSTFATPTAYLVPSTQQPQKESKIPWWLMIIWAVTIAVILIGFIINQVRYKGIKQ